MGIRTVPVFKTSGTSTELVEGWAWGEWHLPFVCIVISPAASMGLETRYLQDTSFTVAVTRPSCGSHTWVIRDSSWWFIQGGENLASGLGAQGLGGRVEGASQTGPQGSVAAKSGNNPIVHQ